MLLDREGRNKPLHCEHALLRRVRWCQRRLCSWHKATCMPQVGRHFLNCMGWKTAAVWFQRLHWKLHPNCACWYQSVVERLPSRQDPHASPCWRSFTIHSHHKLNFSYVQVTITVLPCALKNLEELRWIIDSSDTILCSRFSLLSEFMRVYLGSYLSAMPFIVICWVSAVTKSSHVVGVQNVVRDCDNQFVEYKHQAHYFLEHPCRL